MSIKIYVELLHHFKLQQPSTLLPCCFCFVDILVLLFSVISLPRVENFWSLLESPSRRKEDEKWKHSRFEGSSWSSKNSKWLVGRAASDDVDSLNHIHNRMLCCWLHCNEIKWFVIKHTTQTLTVCCVVCGKNHLTHPHTNSEIIKL